ncbi:biopolymer transporter ExbD [Corallococcus praedator]|uniref:Biopolymer transporter ExbD n=1 Tax=Corallococcus praedator TaxID=2316724 RepID=A0ABX9QLK9_9BACT|nr:MULTISPECIES: biopolymer transporter ExbD [Corallococcus]RKH10299.1 biopolymer transporter ExbD [Corallococcus sp. CA047B]RKH26261.1 biopolymer transporter ExbD [Corallococcus sp. CA031C]RKI12526.1 biopolymer transporter ExbD [Corallococcus praedator]
MAFYYSRRKLKPREEEEGGELNIVPYLDILMNLIIFMLLSITGLTAFGALNVSAPTYGGGASASAGLAEADAPKLMLQVLISEKGLYVRGNGKEAAAPEGDAPTLPRRADGTYDYAALNARLVKIKAEFPQETKVIVAADPNIPYDALIQTMDALRETAGPTERKLLFPDVTLSTL